MTRSAELQQPTRNKELEASLLRSTLTPIRSFAEVKATLKFTTVVFSRFNEWH